MRLLFQQEIKSSLFISIIGMKSKVDVVCKMPERWAEKKLELGNNDVWIIQYDVSNP